MAWHSLQENEAIFSKIYIFFSFRQNFQKTTILLTKSAVLAAERYTAYQVKGVDVLYKKIKCFFPKKIVSKILDNFQKIRIFDCSFFVIDLKMMVNIAAESA